VLNRRITAPELVDAETSEVRLAAPVILFPSSAGIGGLEAHVVQLGRGLVARGLVVAAVCLPRLDLEPMRLALSESGVRTHLLPGRAVSPFAAARRLAGLVSILRTYPGCIVHMHYGGYGGGELIQIAAGFAGASAVVRTEHVPPVPPITVHGRLMVKVRDHFLARVICVAQQNRVEHIRQLGRDPRKIAVVPNGIDLARYAPRAVEPSVYSEFGLRYGTPLVGTVARLTEERKGIDRFLEMAVRVLEAMPAVRFLVVGEGDLRADLERQAQRLGTSDKVLFVGERSDVPRLLAAMRVFVMPSLYEAGPLTVLEALAMARPIVSTPVGLVPELIPHDGDGGRLVPVGDSMALAAAVLDLLGDEAAAQRMADSGQQRVIAHFSLDAMVDRTLEIYRAVVDPSQLLLNMRHSAA
jgi:glycosyltransferase involved in cell wall biosynthesis